MELESSFSYLFSMRTNVVSGKGQLISLGVDPDENIRQPNSVLRDRAKDGWGFEDHHRKDAQIQTSDNTEPESQRVDAASSPGSRQRTTEGDEAVDLDAIAEDFFCQYAERIAGGLNVYDALAEYNDVQELQAGQAEYILTQLEGDTPTSASSQNSTDQDIDTDLGEVMQGFITWVCVS